LGTSPATITGTKKIPPPMTFEMTMAAASSAPSRRSSTAADGRATLLRELARQGVLGEFHPLRRAVLGEDVYPHVLELRVLEDVGARLRGIAGVAGGGAHGQQVRLVAGERDALLEDLVPIVLGGLSGCDRGAWLRQLLEDDVDRQRPQVVL